MSPQEKAAAIAGRKGSRPISALTCYDYPTARLLDEAGTDILLVGDSLGMVVLGFPDTTHVTLAHILHHLEAVVRAKPRALVIADLPIHTYETPEQALESAQKLFAAGADAVKLEGGIRQAEKVRAITAAGIPVCGHLGMLPQRVLEEGGYHKKGKTPEQTRAILEGAQALIDAGVFAIILESVTPAASREITAAISVPTIGIGCGLGNCDGEIAVITDLLGSFPWFVPPFAKPEADLAAQTTEAAGKYISRVRGLRQKKLVLSQMKKFIAAFLLIFLPIIASADDELSPKLVGTWWGTMTTIPPAKPAGNGHWVCVNQHVWVIQRTTDGRYRKQGFRVDNELKVYCVASSSSGVGSWRVSGKNLLTHQFDEGSTGTDQVSVLEGRINWTGGSMSGPEVKWECQEVSIPKFESKIDSSYRRLSIHEFNDRYLKQSGHKGVDKSAIAPDSKPEGDKK